MTKKSSLHDLSKASLREEDKPFVKSEILAGSDRSAALIACSLVDLALVNAIAGHFVGQDDDKTRQARFYGPNAVLPDMSTRTSLACALGMFGTQMEAMLNIIRRVRNAFAHSALLLTFDEPSIRDACLLLPETTLDQVFPGEKHQNGMRERYISTCLQIQIVLNDHADQIRQIQKPIYIPNA